MRVLEIRFLNLNSLAGEWRIDFSHPAYSRDGLFAITGPTGAGKSTILDAIVLALYGQTPRLGRITKSANEMMTRNTGECWAEAAFTASGGVYRAMFSQHRSRRSPQGELQAPRHEVGELESGLILAKGLKETPEAVEKLTGLDFERFIRSVLLPQGGFASFLNAEPAQRAPILEELTGTVLYSQISIKTHELKREAEEELKRLEARGEALKLLSPEQEAELEARISGNEQKRALTTKNLARNREALNLADQAAEARRARAELGLEAREICLRSAATAAERAESAIAEAAQSLTALAARLKELQARREANQSSASILAAKRPQLAGELAQAEAEAQQARADLSALEAAGEKQRELLQTIRLLDDRLSAGDRQLQEAAQGLSELEESCSRARKVLADTEKRLAEAQKKCRRLGDYQRDFAQDQFLAVNLPLWQRKTEELGGLSGRIKELSAADQNLAEIQNNLAAELTRAEKLNRWQEEKFHQSDKELKALQMDMAGRLGPRTLKETRAELEGLRRREAALAEACGLQARLQAAEARQRELAEQRELALKGLEQAERRLADLDSEARKLAEEAEKQNLTVKAWERRQSFTVERARLSEGEPCPLCGSPHHPWAEESAPTPEPDQLKARRAAAGRDKAIAEKNAFGLEVAGLKKECELGGRDLDAAGAARQRLAEDLAALAAGWSAGAAPNFLNLTQELEAQRLNVAALSQSLEQVEGLEEIEQKKRAGLMELERARSENKLALERGRLELDKARAEREHRQEELKGLQLRLERENADLRAATSVYLKENRQDNQPEILAGLAHRAAAWAEAMNNLKEAESAREQGHLQAGVERERLQKLTEEAAARKASEAGLANRQAALREERHALFGDKDPQAEERLARLALKRAATMADEAKNGQWRIQDGLSRLDNERKFLAEADTALALEQGEARKEFERALAENGFSGYEQYEQALRPVEVLAAIKRRIDDYDKGRAALKTRLLDNRRLLKNLKTRALAPDERAELALETEGLEQELGRLNEDRGGLLQTLRGHQATKEAEKILATEIAQKAKVLSRRQRLHDLIGSADGKKYRNFVQSLTFEQMIRQANLKLARLTDRYQLIREAGSCLGLAVIDHYQFGEIRSTRNLSGGESFLISLALALGLAQMASRRVRVESLFLDEGFGALDEEALDSALTVLATLPRDGKLIGLISHVPAVRERVAVQVRVRPLPGGRGRLEGPGCAATVLKDKPATKQKI